MTNPAIDPLRENLVMSLDMYLGKKGNAIEPATEKNAEQIKIESPVVNENEMKMIENSGRKVAKLSTLYALSEGPEGLRPPRAVWGFRAEGCSLVGLLPSARGVSSGASERT